MLNSTVYQFLGGLFVGGALCLLIVNHAHNFQEVRGLSSPENENLWQVRKRDFASSFRRWFRLVNNNASDTEYLRPSFNNDKRNRDRQSNKTIITCIVPFNGNLLPLSQSEYRVLITWEKACDHLIYMDYGRQLNTKPQFLGRVNGLIMETNIKRGKSPVLKYQVYWSGKLGGYWPEIAAQYKALMYGYKKYQDTSVFIFTPTATEVVVDSIKRRLYNSGNDHLSAKQLKEAINSTQIINAIFSADESLIIGKNAVTNILSKVTFNVCPIRNNHSFKQWVSQCIGSRNSVVWTSTLQ